MPRAVFVTLLPPWQRSWSQHIKKSRIKQIKRSWIPKVLTRHFIIALKLNWKSIFPLLSTSWENFAKATNPFILKGMTLRGSESQEEDCDRCWWSAVYRDVGGDRRVGIRILMLGCACQHGSRDLLNNSDLKVAANHTEKWTITLPFICSVNPWAASFWPWKIPVHSEPLFWCQLSPGSL